MTDIIDGVGHDGENEVVVVVAPENVVERFGRPLLGLIDEDDLLTTTDAGRPLRAIEPIAPKSPHSEGFD